MKILIALSIFLGIATAAFAVKAPQIEKSFPCLEFEYQEKQFTIECNSDNSSSFTLHHIKYNFK